MSNPAANSLDASSSEQPAAQAGTIQLEDRAPGAAPQPMSKNQQKKLAKKQRYVELPTNRHTFALLARVFAESAVRYELQICSQ